MPSIGKGAQLQIRGTWSAGPGDDQARFLADLRSLRDSAAIGYDELAARAHFPSDILKEAENGSGLPGLPILTAYVRACEGDVTEWEERWRRLASEVPEDPDLPVRPAGASPAAVAGARAGVGIAPPEVYDPERIRAALRGGHERSDQGGRRTGGAGWDTPADQTIKTANGNYAADSWSTELSDAAAWPDSAKSAEHIDQFQWLPDNGPAARSADQGQADAGPAGSGPAGSGQADDWRDNGRNGNGQVAAAFDVAPAEPTAGEWAPRHRDDVLKPPERTDFWTTQNMAASTDVQPPATASHWVEDQDLTQSTWSTPTETMAASSDSPAASQPSQQAATGPVPSAGSVTAMPTGKSAVPVGYTGSTRSAAGKSTTTERAGHQSERLFTATRLLVIIVIAALIGSALVLLLT
ncbi:MAG TPA: hypothetical protein VHN16_08765 [Streptosporangiaceae bacterium]|nr:hypothetical protein [Streptosporangiaceae bacterium]